MERRDPNRCVSNAVERCSLADGRYRFVSAILDSILILELLFDIILSTVLVLDCDVSTAAARRSTTLTNTTETDRTVGGGDRCERQGDSVEGRHGQEAAGAARQDAGWQGAVMLRCGNEEECTNSRRSALQTLH